MARIFISYSSKDKEFANRLYNDLQKFGHEPWLDELKIKVGECIVTKIEDTLQYPGQIKVTVLRETRAVDYAK